MAKKPGKKYSAAFKQVETRAYPLDQAVPLLQKIKFAKFDETVEIHMRLGVDPKHADQMVRGTVLMPNGLGKSKIVFVIASGGWYSAPEGTRGSSCPASLNCGMWLLTAIWPCLTSSTFFSSRYWR